MSGDLTTPAIGDLRRARLEELVRGPLPDGVLHTSIEERASMAREILRRRDADASVRACGSSREVVLAALREIHDRAKAYAADAGMVSGVVSQARAEFFRALAANALVAINEAVQP